MKKMPISRAEVSACKSLEELMLIIAKIIKTNYKEFEAYLERNNMTKFYEEQSSFVRRMMFFDYAGEPVQLRKAVNDWLLYGECWDYEVSLRVDALGMGDKKFVERAEDLKNFVGCWDGMVETMTEEIQNILDKNPILKDNSISVNARKIVLNQALKSNYRYTSCCSMFNTAVKESVSTMITEAIGGDKWGCEGAKNFYRRA